MSKIWIKNLELFEKWVLSTSSNIACLDYGIMYRIYYGGSIKWNCILTFKNGKKAIVQMK